MCLLSQRRVSFYHFTVFILVPKVSRAPGWSTHKQNQLKMSELSIEKAIGLQIIRFNRLKRNFDIFSHPSTPKSSEVILRKRQAEMRSMLALRKFMG